MPWRPSLRAPLNRRAVAGAARIGPTRTHTHAMLDPIPPALPADGRWPLVAAADLQDHLMVASNDLERLQRLLDDAAQALLGHFTHATQRVDGALAAFDGEAHPMHDVRAALGNAITALQFQDMASQLIAHTSRRLRNCADRLARDAMGADDEGEALVEPLPLRPNPVTQDEMDAGSVELF